MGYSGGAGGAAKARATANSSGPTFNIAVAHQTGGDGGEGWSGANGHAGADSELDRAVTGKTNGGELILEQQATGGNGGNGGIGAPGKGGDAISCVAFDDNQNQTQSKSVLGGSTAQGGRGGESSGGAGQGGDGGTAFAESTIVAAETGGAYAQAYGGGGGNGGDAEARTLVDARNITPSDPMLAGSEAAAIGGYGTRGFGRARATANGHGTSGTFRATAQSGPSPWLMPSPCYVTACADGVVNHAGMAAAVTGIGDAGDLPSGAQATARVIGRPNNARVGEVLGKNAKIAAALGANPLVLLRGELGGQTPNETASTLSFSASVRPQIARRRLVVGCYGYTRSARISPLFLLIFDIMLGGKPFKTRIFTSDSDAESFFSDHVLDLRLDPFGSYASCIDASGYLSLAFSLTLPADARQGHIRLQIGLLAGLI